jgi:hypothetical protein
MSFTTQKPRAAKPDRRVTTGTLEIEVKPSGLCLSLLRPLLGLVA